MGVTKPTSVSKDPFRSAKWDEICDGRDFKPSDAPALTLLVQWYQVVDKCIEDMVTDGGIEGLSTRTRWATSAPCRRLGR